MGGALHKGFFWAFWALGLLAWILALVGLAGMQSTCFRVGNDAQGVTPQAGRFRAVDCSRVLSLPW